MTIVSEEYKVQLDAYNGPLDLLLYLIRREEVDIHDIPIARITEQYLAYVQVIERLDPNESGEFLVLSATLLEIKSRMLLPKPPPEPLEEDIEDPRLELVHQLLEYKRIKDAAAQLEVAADRRAVRFERRPPGLQKYVEAEVDLEGVQVWDLLSAFGKLLSQIGLTGRKHEVVYDDTPLIVHAEEIVAFLQRSGGSLQFLRVFEQRPKGQIIGLFLALLELVRCKRLRAEQDTSRDMLVLHLLDASPLAQAELAEAEGLEGPKRRVTGNRSEVPWGRPQQEAEDDP